MKKETTKKNVTPFKKGDYTGINDKKGNQIKLGDTVKITIGKPNDGYRVIFEAGAFCFTGGKVGTCSFIKFRDELIEGRISGKPIHAPFQSFLEIVLTKPDKAIAQGTGVNYKQPNASGGSIS